MSNDLNIRHSDFVISAGLVTVSRLKSDCVSETEERHHLPAPLIALAGWLVPGLGYALIGEKSRALVAGLTIFALFISGLLIGGIRVVDVPGYYARTSGLANDQIKSEWKLRGNAVGEVMNRPWYMAQALMGPANMLASYASISVTPGVRQSTSRIFDIGTLYTAVAGMLNLLVLIDAAHRSAYSPAPGTKGES